MVAPVSGPLVTQAQSGSGQVGSFFVRTEKYKQARPLDRPLPYLRVVQKTKTRTEHFPDYVANREYTYPGNWNPWWVYALSHKRFSGLVEYQSILDNVINDARAKFIGKLGESAELGTSIAERQKSFDMIANRVGQVALCLRQLRRGDLVGCAYALGWTSISAPRRTGKNRVRMRLRKGPRTRTVDLRMGARHAASNFLEFHFGWSPLLGDIYNACDVLSKPIPGFRSKGVARRSTKEFKKGSTAPNIFLEALHELEFFCLVQADWVVSNPNLRLASQLGLINPALTAWELFPFSFVLDWFVNLSDFLGSFTDTAGISLSYAFNTVTVRDRCYTREYSTGPSVWGSSPVLGWSVNSEAFTISREMGIPDVKLRIRSPWTLKPARALSAVSLLIQQGLSPTETAALRRFSS